MSDVRLTEIHKSFGNHQVIQGVSLEIRSGEFLSLLGASGCGKTTLLRIIAGLESVGRGQVEIDGRDVTQLAPEQRDISMMFQSYALLPHLSVFENVRFPLRMRRLGTLSQQAARVQDALEKVRLGHLASRQPRELSGGQQQRVALARAIVSEPKVLLLDEPLSNLDARLREDMQVELIELHRSLGLTTIFVTHDQEEALSLSSRVVLLNAGRIEQEGSPKEIYARPASPFSSTFLGGANLLPVRIEIRPQGVLAVLPDGQSLPLSGSGFTEGPATLAIRQEDLALENTALPGLRVRVRTRIYLGSRNRYVIQLASHDIKVLTGTEVEFAAGEEATLRIAPEKIRVMPVVA